MSWRKFAVLVRGLPDDSRLVTAQIDGVRDLKDRPKPDGPAPTPRWSQMNWQLHALQEEMRRLQFVLMQVNSDKKVQAPAPLPTPVDRRKPLVSAEDKARAFLAMTAQLKFEGQG